MISLLSDFVVDFMYSICSDRVEGKKMHGKRDRLCCMLIVLTICLRSRQIDGHNSKEQIMLYIVL